jgi:acetyl-CoA carboxylase biotin carboxylase subunit
LLGKVIVWGRDRTEAADRMERALAETVITGVPQTVPFLRRVIADEAYRRNELYTDFIADNLARLTPPDAAASSALDE